MGFLRFGVDGFGDLGCADWSIKLVLVLVRIGLLGNIVESAFVLSSFLDTT